MIRRLRSSHRQSCSCRTGPQSALEGADWVGGRGKREIVNLGLPQST